MSTSMMMNLKLFGDTSSGTIDATIYREMIGLLIYLKNTQPDIFFAVKTLSQYMVDLRQVHLVATKHVLRYLKGMIDYGLRYARDCNFSLVGHMDLDWVGSVLDQKSTCGCCFSLRLAVITWHIQK